MSMIQFGLPLEASSTQSLLPYITDSGRIYGFFPIATHTFTGAETSYTVAPGVTVTVTTVTLPPTVSTNLRQQQRVPQYMAAYFPSAIEGQRPWTGYSTLVRTDKPNILGFYSWWSMPVMSIVQHFNYGTYLNALISGMDPTVPVGSPVTPPVTTPASLTWACTIDPIALTPDCAFFDFSWTELFATSPLYNPDQPGNTVVPVQLNVVSNPAGGYFKAVLVQTVGQTIYPGGGVSFDTVRILRLQDPPAGTYTFNFTIQYNQSSTATSLSSVPAVLNLTVV